MICFNDLNFSIFFGIFFKIWIRNATFCFCLRGFKYLYLPQVDYKKVSAMNSVLAELIKDEEEPRYKIIDIIGEF